MSFANMNNYTSDISNLLLDSGLSVACINSMLAGSNVGEPNPRPFHLDWYHFYVKSDSSTNLLSIVKLVLEDLEIEIVPDSPLCNRYNLTCIKYNNLSQVCFEVNIFLNKKSQFLPQIKNESFPFIIEIVSRSVNKQSFLNYFPFARIWNKLKNFDQIELLYEDPFNNSTTPSWEIKESSKKMKVPEMPFEYVQECYKKAFNFFHSNAHPNFLVKDWTISWFNIFNYSHVDEFLSYQGVSIMKKFLTDFDSNMVINDIDQIRYVVLSTIEKMMDNQSFHSKMMEENLIKEIFSLVNNSLKTGKDKNAFQSKEVRHKCASILSLFFEKETPEMSLETVQIVDLMAEKGDDYVRSVSATIKSKYIG